MHGRHQKVSIWFQAIRLHTLSAGVVPVLIGNFLADAVSILILLLTLCGGMLIQISTNLIDEYADADKPPSQHSPTIPHKVIAQGLLTIDEVRYGARLSMALALLIGLILTIYSGWMLLPLLILGAFIAWSYSAGPYPLGEHGWGEVLVFILMGPLMVEASYYAQVGHFSLKALVYSLPVGCTVAAILLVNNMRDLAEDKKSGKVSLVTLFGLNTALQIYYSLLIVAIIIGFYIAGWVFIITIPLAYLASQKLRKANFYHQYHEALKLTALNHLVLGLVLCLAA